MPEWIEMVESRKFASSGGRGNGSRTFMASGYANPKALLASFGVQTITGSTETAPLKGDSHSDFPGLIARDFSATPEPGHNNLWRVEWQYEQITPSYLTAPADPIEELPNEVSYVELSSEIRAEFVLEYRRNPKIPSRGIPEEPEGPEDEKQDPEVDIRGEPIAPGGNPTSSIRRIQELTLTETVQGEPDFGRYGVFRFARNSAPFLGARPGRVLYRGASVRRTGVEVYQVSHTFIDDEAFHLVQQPLVDQEGRPLLDEDRFPRLVYFIQPFDQMLDLNGISDNF